jgi:N-acetylmuramoyl-L-alanine amidase
MMSDPPVRPCSALVQKLYPSPNHGERRGCAGPDSIILHYTGMRDAASALLWLANPLSQVSAHYLLFEDGRIFQMVPENRRAWHAGRSAWQGETDMNSRSIGIEIVNPGHDLTVEGPFPPLGPAYPDMQIAALIVLLRDIVTRWNIPARRILAHSDIAPGRKIDPGEWFPWEKLAKAGLGLWPKAPIPVELASPIRYQLKDEGMPIAALQSMLVAFGYGIEISGVYDQKTFDVIAAFQRHWRQSRVDGVADGETLALLRKML